MRATARRREIALRIALGATRRTVIRQLVTESVVLALAGGVAGLLVIPQVNALIVGILPPGIPLPLDLDPPLDGKIFGFAFALSLLTGILFGLLPALQSSRPDVQQALQEGTPGAGAAPGRQRLRRALVVAQLALAVVLLAATGLFLVSLHNAARIDPGFDRQGVLLVGFDFPAAIDRTSAIPFYRRVLERVSALPGVEAASYGNHPPLWIEGGDWEEVAVDGYTPGPEENMKIDVTLTWPGYFALMRMPLSAGRDFAERDDARSQRVAIVNEAFASRYLAGRPPVGAKLRVAGNETIVVGLVRTAKYRNLTEPPRPFVYLPQLQTLPAGTALHVRVAPGTPRRPDARPDPGAGPLDRPARGDGRRRPRRRHGDGRPPAASRRAIPRRPRSPGAPPLVARDLRGDRVCGVAPDSGRSACASRSAHARTRCGRWCFARA